MKRPVFATRPEPAHSGPRPVEALSITCEGLWLLQALCGVETLPSNLVLRPYISEIPAPTSHPGLAVLREAGVVVTDEHGSDAVHPQVALWLEALGAPDVVLCAMVTRGLADLRVAIARRGTLTVSAARFDDEVTIEEVGSVGSMRGLLTRLLPMCGPECAPAEFEPIVVPSAALLDGLAQIVRGDQTPAVALRSLGLDPQQRRVVTAAADEPEMQLSIAVVRHDSDGDHVGVAAVSVTDTHEGRVVTGPVRSEDGSWWTMVTPGTPAAGGRALETLLATVGLGSWGQHRRYP